MIQPLPMRRQWGVIGVMAAIVIGAILWFATAAGPFGLQWRWWVDYRPHGARGDCLHRYEFASEVERRLS